MKKGSKDADPHKKIPNRKLVAESNSRGPPCPHLVGCIPMAYPGGQASGMRTRNRHAFLQGLTRGMLLARVDQDIQRRDSNEFLDTTERALSNLELVHAVFCLYFELRTPHVILSYPMAIDTIYAKLT